MSRPSSLFDQYCGKAKTEFRRGSGWWPLQAHPIPLEPPWEPFDRDRVNLFDCWVNDWEGPYEEGGWFSSASPAMYTQGSPLELPEEPCPDWNDLVPVVVEPFVEDESTLAKAEQFLRALPGLQRPLSFEVIGIGPRPQFDQDKALELIKAGKKLDAAITSWTDPYTQVQFVAHRRDASAVQRLLLSHYPNSSVTVGESLDAANSLDPGFGINNGDGVGAELALESAYCFPLRTFSRIDPDPLGVAVAALEQLGDSEWAMLQVLFTPTTAPWADTMLAALEEPYQPGKYLFESPDMRLVHEKFRSPLFAVSVRLLAKKKSVYRQFVGWAEQFAAPPHQRLVVNDSVWEEDEMPPWEREQFAWSVLARCTHRPGLLVNAEELSGLVHLPGPLVVSDRLRRIKSRTRAAAATSPEKGSVVLGENVHQGQRRPVRLPATLRSRHCYIAGASGTGKSTLLLNMITQDITAGHGVGVLDPHGDLVQAVLRRIPAKRCGDVILFDPADQDFPFALNLLEAKNEAERERIVAETVMALERYFPSSWGPRLERILTFAIYTVLHAIPGATLADVERLLTDEKFRKEVIGKTKDSRFLQFWNTQFVFMPKNAVDPVLNKLSVFLLNRTVRNIICQRHSALDFDGLLNKGKILLANLSTGLLTEKIAGMFGSFLVTKIVNAAFRRARLPEDQRRPWYIYIDEFQAFMNLSVGFERILAEARKYKLVLAGLANQYVGQLSQPVRQAVFGNVGSFIVFRLGVDDAHLVAKELGVFTGEEILNLEVGQAIARAGGSATAFNLQTFAEPPVEPVNPTKPIVGRIRRQYARKREEVERELGGLQEAEERLGKAALKGGEEAEDPSEDDLVR